MGHDPPYITIDLEPAVPADALDRYGDDLRTALLIRRAEQRLLSLFSEGKLFGTVHTCIGQEFVGVAVSRALGPEDTVFSNHRGHGHYLSRTGDAAGLIGEVMGKRCGVCAGRGGSQHLQRGSYYSNGIQGGIAPVTAGLAYALKERGSRGLSVVYLGDGTLGQGALYETMNIASKWALPVLFVCENNLFAQSTSQTQTLAGDIEARARAFGIETARADTWRWPDLFDAARRAADTVRATGRPFFLRVDTFRLMAHSKGDDNRPEEYVRPHRDRDPLNALEARFKDDPRWRAMSAEIDRVVAEAVAQAEASPFADPEPVPRWTGPRRYEWAPKTFARERVVASVKRGLDASLRAHPGVVLIGEDIESPYGGAFKCTQGLSAEFPGRVRNTPISELAIVGLGNGMALAGLKPVVEIMFGDFLGLAMDQWLNHAAKFRYMFNDKVTVPIVIRTPMGGKRGYAATHSQSIEKHFLGVPGTQVLCLHHRMSPGDLYAALLDSIDRPTLVIENKILYGQWASAEAPPGFELLHTTELFPTARVRPRGDADLTILAVGGLSIDAEQAAIRLFDEEEVAADLFLPTRLYPFDADVLLPSLERTRRLLVVEEGQGFVSFSSEVLAQVAERFGPAPVQARRVTAAACPIPAARPLEEHCLPGPGSIVAAAMEMMRELVH